jgi:hypothetical protein
MNEDKRRAAKRIEPEEESSEKAPTSRSRRQFGGNQQWYPALAVLCKFLLMSTFLPNDQDFSEDMMPKVVAKLVLHTVREENSTPIVGKS